VLVSGYGWPVEIKLTCDDIVPDEPKKQALKLLTRRTQNACQATALKLVAVFWCEPPGERTGLRLARQATSRPAGTRRA